MDIVDKVKLINKKWKRVKIETIKAYLNVHRNQNETKQQILYQDSWINDNEKILTHIQNINISVIKTRLKLVCKI